MESGIYIIINTLNNHRYVGSAVNIKGRWSKHVSDLVRGRHYNKHLQRAWTKYGKQCFAFYVMEFVSDALLIEAEQFYIDLLKPEYNILPRAGSPLGVRLSAATKKKIGDANRRRVWTGESRAKVSAARLGKKHTEDAKKKMSAARKGKKQSAEHVFNRTSTRIGTHPTARAIQNMSEAQKKRQRRNRDAVQVGDLC